jgi:hypothetical protein
MTTSNSINSRSTGYLLLKAHSIFLYAAYKPTRGALIARARSNGAHYIYTTWQVQYKRSFEMAAGQIKHSCAAHDWRFCRIDRQSRCGQDTGGFALVVG